MKKNYLLMAAAAAMMLTACTSENDILESGPAKQAVPQEVGFDVYTPAATNVTRAGLEGTMTTGRLQRSEYEGGGFGVYAFQVQDQQSAAGYGVAATAYAPSVAPNFMVNEKLLWNATNQGWYYNPLKYWPNETDKDSQDTPAEMTTKDGTANRHIDRLTFFAYAPYVSTTATTEGINYVTNNNGYLATGATAAAADLSTTKYNNYNSGINEPSVAYKAATDDPNKAVDLLWGVAPAGGLEYTAVNGQTVKVKEGMPLIDMTKPNVNTNMKFLFQHALARIGVTAVAAIDQVGAGGKLDPNTKITIEKIELTGWFGETGILNLDNTKENVANWRFINGVNLVNKSSAVVVGNGSGEVFDGGSQTTLTLEAKHTADNNYSDATDFANHQKGTIARHLQFVNIDKTVPAQTAVSEDPVAQKNRIGVTTVRQNVIMPALINNTLGTNPGNRNWYTSKAYAANELKYSETTPYYLDENCTNQAVATVYNDITASTPQGVDGSHFVYTVNDAGVYFEHKTNITLQYPQVNNYYNVTFKEVGNGSGQITAVAAAKKQAYTKTTYSSIPSQYTPKAVGIAPANGDWVIDGEVTQAVAAYATATTYYKRDNNYFMVVPLNNVPNICTSLDEEDLKELYKVRVKIEYYITTEDSKLANGRAQTKNVIEKDVIFPSIANGKSYNLNLILGLTSVKMEAEVDDWKVINVQGDLPQNTAE